jgi:uncharacterized membrane protein YjjP (DUF1212 family)
MRARTADRGIDSIPPSLSLLKSNPEKPSLVVRWFVTFLALVACYTFSPIFFNGEIDG